MLDDTSTRSIGAAVPLALMLTFLLFWPAAGHASTPFGYGTIVAVDADGGAFTVVYEFYNGARSEIWPRLTYRFRKSTRHGQSVYFLDGEPSTPEEALAVGRAFCQQRTTVFYLSSGPGPYVDRAGGLADGLGRLILPGAAPARYTIRGSRGTQAAMRSLGGVELLLDLGEDDIRGALVLGFHKGIRCDHLVDCSKLVRWGNQLAGTVAVTVRVPEPEAGKGKYKLEDGETLELVYAIDATVGPDGSLSGKYSGRCNASEVAGAIRGSILARSAAPESPRVWLQLHTTKWVKAARSLNYVVLTFADGQARPGGYVLFDKGNRLGEVVAQDLRLDATTLTGTFTAEIEDVATTFTIDAQVLAGRWIVGPYRAISAGETLELTLRGGLCEADACRIEGIPREQKDLIKRMQAEVEAASPAPESTHRADPARAESVDQADKVRGGGCLPDPGAAPFGLGLD